MTPIPPIARARDAARFPMSVGWLSGASLYALAAWIGRSAPLAGMVAVLLAGILFTLSVLFAVRALELSQSASWRASVTGGLVWALGLLFVPGSWWLLFPSGISQVLFFGMLGLTTFILPLAGVAAAVVWWPSRARGLRAAPFRKAAALLLLTGLAATGAIIVSTPTSEFGMLLDYGPIVLPGALGGTCGAAVVLCRVKAKTAARGTVPEAMDSVSS